MNVETVPIDSIHADPANVRRHPEKNLASIKASLARFGQQKPIVVDQAGIVRAGNGTLEAARALGWESIEVTRSPLQGTEATAYAIADNRTSDLSEWDETGLAESLRALQSEDFDMAAVGYDAEEVDALIERLGTSLIDETDWPQITAPDSHVISLRYRDADTPVILQFIGETNPLVLTEGKAGVKILERIRNGTTN